MGCNSAPWAVAPRLVGRILEDGEGQSWQGRLVRKLCAQGHCCPRKASSPRSPVCLGLWTGTDAPGAGRMGRRCARGGWGGRKGSTSAQAQHPPPPPIGGASQRPRLLPAGRLGTRRPRRASPPSPLHPAWPACRSTSARPSAARTLSAPPWL